jgi:RES domain-containing protein
MLPPPALQQALQGASLTAVRGPWYRAVNYDQVIGPPRGARSQPLWGGGAARQGARFTPPAPTGPGGAGAGIDCLYLAEDEVTPLLEIAGVLRPPGSSIPLLFVPQVMMTVDGVLTDVLDLTDSGIQRLLGTSDQELTGHWLMQQAMHLAGQGSPPPTQRLGAEAFAAGHIVGLRYRSSKNPQGVGIMVFPTRLVQGRHSLAVFNHAGGTLQQSLPKGV